MFKNIFSGKKAAAGPTTLDSITKLRETEDRLEKQQAYFEKQIEQQTATARANATTNKRIALQALKKKKLIEKQQLQNDGVLSTIQFQRSALENAATNAEIMSVMSTAAEAMKSAHKNMKVDDIQSMMDDIADQQDVANEISSALSNPGFGHDIDQDDLEAELRALQEETLQEQLIDIKPTPTANLDRRMPDAPRDALPSRQRNKKELDDMAALEEWAS